MIRIKPMEMKKIIIVSIVVIIFISTSTLLLLCENENKTLKSSLKRSESSHNVLNENYEMLLNRYSILVDDHNTLLKEFDNYRGEFFFPLYDFSPHDRVSRNSIEVYDNNFTVYYDCLLFSQIEGSSMQPLFGNEHHVVMTKCFTKNDLEVGDIISFKYELHSEGTTIHQIVRIEEDKYITRGLHNPVEDEPVEFENIRGIVIAIIY